MQSITSARGAVSDLKGQCRDVFRINISYLNQIHCVELYSELTNTCSAEFCRGIQVVFAGLYLPFQGMYGNSIFKFELHKPRPTL